MNNIQVADESVDLMRGTDHIGVAVCAVIHDGNGRILLMKRGPKARDERGNWDICGGAIEFGESIIDAIEREVSEELCCSPQDINFVTAYDAHRENDGKKTHWVALVHAVKVNPAEVMIGEPHKISEINWFKLASLPSPLHSQFHKILSVISPLGIIK